jgi:hypothetical protein
LKKQVVARKFSNYQPSIVIPRSTLNLEFGLEESVLPGELTHLYCKRANTHVVPPTHAFQWWKSNALLAHTLSGQKQDNQEKKTKQASGDPGR